MGKRFLGESCGDGVKTWWRQSLGLWKDLKKVNGGRGDQEMVMLMMMKKGEIEGIRKNSERERG